jgi:hypothetical protein
VSPAATSVPVIVAAAVAAGHDGRAEAVLDVRYPNGAVRSVTVTEDAVVDAVRPAGVERLEDLCGHPWTVLVAPATDDHRHNDSDDDSNDDSHNDSDSDSDNDGERPCST